MRSSYNEQDSPALTPTSPTANLSSFYSDFAAFQSAWKTSYSIPVIVVQKISNIIDQYYKLKPQLKKKQNQLSILLKYNTKLIQTIEQFRVHQKKIITASNTLMNLYKTSMKKYCQNRHLDLDFFDSIQIHSIFEKFSMKEWKFEPDQPKKRHINKKYKDQLLNIFKKFYLFEDAHLQNKAQKLVKDLKKSREQKSLSPQKQKIIKSLKIVQEQMILNQITEYNQKIKNLNVNNMFDLLQQRKIVQNLIKEIQFKKSITSQQQLEQDQMISKKIKANIGLMDQKDYQFVNQVKKLHASIQDFQSQTIKNYISNQKQYKLKLKKQQHKIKAKFQKFHNQLLQEYTELKEQLKQAIEEKQNISNQMQMYTAQKEFLSMKQTINKKPTSNMSIQQSFVGGSSKKKQKQKPNDYKVQIKKLKDTITELSSQIWNQTQYEELGLKKSRLDQKIISLKEIHQKLSDIESIVKKCTSNVQERQQSQKDKKLQNSSKSLSLIPKFAKKKSGQSQNEQDKDLNSQTNSNEASKTPQQLSKQIGNILEYIRNFSIKIMKNMQLQQKFNLSRSIDPEMLKVCMDQLNNQNLSQISQPPNLQKQSPSEQESSKSFGLSSDKPKINIISPLANNVSNTADQKFLYNKDQIPISPIYHQSGNSIWNISQANLLPIQQQSKCDYSRNIDFSHHTLPQQGSDLLKKNDPFLNSQNKNQEIKKSQSFSYKLPSQIQNQKNLQQKHQHLNDSPIQVSIQKTHNLLFTLNLNQQKSKILQQKNQENQRQNELLKTQIANLKMQLSKLQNSLKQAQQKHKNKIRQFEELLSIKAKQNQTIKTLQIKIQQLQNIKAIDQKQKQQNSKQNLEHKQKIDELKKLSERYEFLRNDLQKNIQKKKEQIKQLQNNLLDKECQKQVAVEKLHRFQEQDRPLIEKINKFQAQNKKLQKKIAQITNQVKTMQQSLKEKQNQNELLKQEKEKTEDKIKQLGKNLQKINQKILKMENQKKQLNVKCAKLLQTQADFKVLKDNFQKLTKQKQILVQKQINLNNILSEANSIDFDISLHSIKSHQILLFMKGLIKIYISLASLNDINPKNFQQMISVIENKLSQKVELALQQQEPGNANPLKLSKKKTVQNSYDLKINRQQHNQKSFSLKNDDSFHSRSYSPPQSINQKRKNNQQRSQISEVPKNNKHLITKKTDDIQFLNVFNCTNSEQKIAQQENSKVDIKIKKKYSQIQNIQQSQDVLMYSKPQQLQQLITNMNQKEKKQINDSQNNSEDQFVSNLLTEEEKPSINRTNNNLVDQKLLKQVQKQLQMLKGNPQAFDLYEIYKKYKQALQCLDFQCKRNRKRQLQYLTYLNSLKRTTSKTGQNQNSKLRLQQKLYFSQRRIEQQRQQLQQQRRQFQGEIKRIIKESQKISNHAIQIIRKTLMEKVMANIFKIPKA